jgi:hypothetical protein
VPQIDMTQLWKFTTMERCVRYHLQQQERYWRLVAPAASHAAGRLHEQSLVLIDMDGAPPSSTCAACWPNRGTRSSLR